MQDVLEYLKNCSLNDPLFEKIIEIMAEKAPEYRASHKGYLPMGIFLNVIKLSGAYVCTEIVPILNGKPVLLLRKKEDGVSETAWIGKYHIPGIAHLSGENLEAAIQRLLKKEILSETAGSPDIKTLNMRKVYELDRGTWCYTFTYTMEIPNISTLKCGETWLWITEDSVDQVIQDHQSLIGMLVRGEKAPNFMDIS